MKTSNNKTTTGIYIHWPFCAAKCPYCDFNSHVAEAIDHDDWLAGYVSALDYYAELTPNRSINSMFFGGGTPSLMRPDVVAAIIDKVQQSWSITNDVEITLEANPTSSERAKFQAFRDAGVNRVSLGVQSLNDADLKFLGREHSGDEAMKAIDLARSIFDRFSFDLIYARPDQTLATWGDELRRAVELSGGHMSLYQLTIERSTPFYTMHKQGLFDIPRDDLAAEFYHLTQDIMEDAGLPAYEVSNHAADEAQQSVHNLNYWRYRDYIGIGPGAHGRLTLKSAHGRLTLKSAHGRLTLKSAHGRVPSNGVKYASRDHAAPPVWLETVQKTQHGAHPFEALSVEDGIAETLIMGLRLADGLILDDAIMAQINRSNLTRICDEGWGAHNGNHLHLTREGLLRLNAIVPFILKD
jgi:putative oxygen-independent coproporphyrinogen III oxidase